MIDKLELRRQIFHICSGLVIVLLLYFDILNRLILFVITIVAILLSLLSRKIKIPVLDWFLKKFEREENLKRFPGKGVVFYLTGAFVVVSLFEKDIAMAAIMILALGDSISHLAGRFGGIKHPFSGKKFFEGAIAGVIAGFLGALLFVVWYEALLASLFAMTAEGLELRLGMQKVDDNIVIPIVAAFVIWVVRLLELLL